MSSLLAIASGTDPTVVEPQLEQHLTAYRQLLLQHDWWWDYADDHSAWLRGHANAKKIESYQRLLDRDWSIWNEYAPAALQRKGK